jgi:hypothetical protein
LKPRTRRFDGAQRDAERTGLVSSQGKQEQHLDGARHRDNAAVEKIPNCFTANFLLKDKTRYDC